MENAPKKQHEKDFVRLATGSLIELKPGAGDSPRAFKMLAYTGAIVSRWYGRLVFELKGIQFKQVTPALKDHDGRAIVGQSSKVSLTSEGLEAEGFVLKSTEAAKEVTRLADENYQWQVSAGLEVLKIERLLDGEVATVNGQQVSGPLYIARESKLREMSFLSVGADGDTSAEILSFFDEETRMSEKKTEEKPATEVLAQERKRVAELKAAYPKDSDFALLAIEKGWSLLEAKAEYADVLAKRNEELQAEKDKLSADLSKSKLGTDPIGHGGSGEGAAKGDFMEQATRLAAEKGISRGTAVTQLAQENPDLHRAWLAKQKPRERVQK